MSEYDPQYDYPHYDEEEWAARVEMFADPGGVSALRRASKDNPRNLPCPSCGWPNRLTPADQALGYQCDSCADAQERGMDIHHYEGDDDAEESRYGAGDVGQLREGR